MGKELERDLGLPSVMAISIGAMVGSGIFILPGLAMKMAGPAVVAAYLLAALLVLPAALSKSEMATAMPESGGTYLYIERGMGPLLGTIAGVGTWFSLTFKGALALVGGAPYLVYLFDLPVTPVAVGVAAVLILVNVVGAKQTGRMQIVIVILMLLAMAWFITFGSPGVQRARFGGFFDSGLGGLLGATGFIFVSYAGVTKIASVAEEIENPDRNVPLGMLGSLGITTAIYVAIVAVLVGVAPADEVVDSAVPMVIAAERVLSTPGVLAVILAALLALISTANAGILSSSRYPLAMSRDGLVPGQFQNVSDRFGTPVRAITLTGGILLLLVAFVPIRDIAKLASAFQIIVFTLINVALIAFREGDVEAYDPSFETPLYPFPQLCGIVGGLVLLTQMGTVPFLGAIAITLGSLVWYYGYVYRRGGVDREGAATDAVRRSVGRSVVAETQEQVDADEYEVLVAVTEQTPPATEHSLVDLAVDVARDRNGRVRVAQFDEVPDQTPLARSAEELTAADESFEQRLSDRSTDSDVPILFGEVVSHDTKHAIVNYAGDTGADALVIERPPDQFPSTVFGDRTDWVEDHAPCDIIEVVTFDSTDIDTISVVTDGGPYDPAKIPVVDGVARSADAEIRFFYPVEPDAPATRRDTIDDYFSELEGMVDAPVETTIVETADRQEAIDVAAVDADLLVVSGTRPSVRDRVFGQRNHGAAETDTVVVYGADQPGPLRRVLRERLF
jgi:amino acid transporter